MSNFLQSISVIQWLLNAETSHPTSSPPHRLTRFFTTLHSALRNPSRAILQFYPSSDDQIQLITSIAQKAGFGGGVVVDYPNSKKARKVFLCLFVGSGGQQVPKGLDGEEVEDEGTARFEKRREKLRRGKDSKRKNVKDKDWILKKKEVCLSSHHISWNVHSTDVTALSATWKRKRSKRLQVYGSQAEACILILFVALSGVQHIHIALSYFCKPFSCGKVCARAQRLHVQCFV